MRWKVYLNRATLCGALGMHGEALGYSSLLFPRYCLNLGIQSSNLGQGIASCIFEDCGTPYRLLKLLVSDQFCRPQSCLSLILHCSSLICNFSLQGMFQQIPTPTDPPLGLCMYSSLCLSRFSCVTHIANICFHCPFVPQAVAKINFSPLLRPFLSLCWKFLSRCFHFLLAISFPTRCFILPDGTLLNYLLSYIQKNDVNNCPFFFSFFVCLS